MLLDNIKIFLDTADIFFIKKYRNDIAGITTNPTIMRKANILDYKRFAQDAIEILYPKPISLEVCSDDFEEMKKQARILSAWGDNVFVKIPITNTKGESSENIIQDLSREGIKLNITAIFTGEQVEIATQSLAEEGNFISVFAGRIADTGRSPLGLVEYAVEMADLFGQEVIWASTRETYNVYEAALIKCHIITITPSIMKKLSLFGMDLTEYSRETVEMFFTDAQKEGYKIEW